MTWLGVDDTDSPRGGCTTFTLTEILRAAESIGVDLIGHPRLVRLNPNIPFKTRGNGALSARFGHGRGERRSVGEGDDGAFWSYPRGRPLHPREAERLFEAAWEATLRTSRRGEPRTEPALVVSPRPFPAQQYWDAVRRVVSLQELRTSLRARGVLHRTEGGRGGLVGASAAIAWRGAHPTWELLAYRRPERWGQPRTVSRDSVLRAERSHPELFLCTDARTRRMMIAPHTACPILLGLRATDPAVLPRAFGSIDTESAERWVVFQTNQATGDHLRPLRWARIDPWSSGRVTGRVATPPQPHRGGHVALGVRDLDGTERTCWAFEPTKTLPPVAAALRPGDRVRVWGGRGSDDSFRLEGLEILATVPRSSVGPNPGCPRCGRRTKSLGSGRGFRCRFDGVRLPPESRASVLDSSAPALGVYHPTPSARRHLAPRAAGGAAPAVWTYRVRPRTHKY